MSDGAWLGCPYMAYGPADYLGAVEHSFCKARPTTCAVPSLQGWHGGDQLAPQCKWLALWHTVLLQLF